MLNKEINVRLEKAYFTWKIVGISNIKTKYMHFENAGETDRKVTKLKMEATGKTGNTVIPNFNFSMITSQQ